MIHRIHLRFFLAFALFTLSTNALAADERDEVTEAELIEMVGYSSGYTTAGELGLDDWGAFAFAAGLHEALNWENRWKKSKPAFPQRELQAAVEQVMARAKAVEAGQEPLPAVSLRTLKSAGTAIGLGSLVKRYGFGAAEADLVRRSFLKGANADEFDPPLKARESALNAFMQERMETAEASNRDAREQALRRARDAQRAAQDPDRISSDARRKIDAVMAQYKANTLNAERARTAYRALDADEQSRLLETLGGHTDAVRSVAFSPDGDHFVSASSDKTVRVWNAAPVAPVPSKLTGHTRGVLSVAFSPDGRRVATGGSDGRRERILVRAWPDGELLSILDGASGDQAISMEFSPNGRRIVSTGGSGGNIRVWNAATGELVSTLTASSRNGYSPSSVDFSPDGKRVVTGGPITIGEDTVTDDAFKEVRIFDVAKRRALSRLAGNPDGVSIKSVSNVTFSPDGQVIATGSSDNTVRIWDAATGAHLSALKGHTKEVLSVVFSPNGRRIASAGSDNVICLWDAQTGELLAAFDGHGGEVNSMPFGLDDHDQRGAVHSVAFSPDGQRIVSGGSDNTVRVWDAATD